MEDLMKKTVQIHTCIESINMGLDAIKRDPIRNTKFWSESMVFWLNQLIIDVERRRNYVTFDQVLEECNAVIEKYENQNLSEDELEKLLDAYRERSRLFAELNSLAYA